MPLALALYTLCLAPGTALPSTGLTEEPHETQIYEGQVAENCQWPTMAMLGFGGCSATLVNPWIVTTAAHCVGNVDNPGDILLGQSFSSPTHQLPVDYCAQNPEYDSGFNNGVNGADISYCKLKQPIYDVPFTPVVYGCEEEILHVGREVYMVGIGANVEEGSGFGTKRFNAAQIHSAPEDLTEGVVIGEVFNAPCSGDSGGPSYVQYPDGSWHSFGVVSGGPPPCGAGADTYAVITAWVPWIEEDSGIDITPCHDVDGTWNPTGWCQGFELDPLDTDGDWDQVCLGEISAASATCGAAFDAVADEDPPNAEITSPTDQERFDGAPVNVEIEIDADDGEGHGVRAVQISINGAVQDTELREPPYIFRASFPQGGYELMAVATDWAGNVGESEIVRIGIDADAPEPPPEPEPEPASTGEVDATAGDDLPMGTGETGDSTGAGQLDGGGGDGCGCTTNSMPGGWSGVLLLLGLGAVRRRRA